MAQETHRALVLSSLSSPPSVQNIPKPNSTPGSALVRVLVANVLPYARIAYTGNRDAPMPTPFVIGSAAVGRVESIGADATLLSPGQLVFVDTFIRARDDPTTSFLFGFREGPTEGSKKLMAEAWRDSTYAEFARVPLENCYPIDEVRLLGKPEDGGLGYHVEDLAFLNMQAVPFGGLRDLNIRAGDTVIVAPATGSFSGAAVQLAVAMGARVIAASRNLKALEEIAATNDRISIAQLKCNDVQADLLTLQKFGQIDAYLDISPPAAAQSTHIESCLMAVKPYGKVSLMGGIRDHIKIPYMLVMFRSIQLRGRFMYERGDVQALVKLYEQGLLRVGPDAGYKPSPKFGLEEWEKAFEEAEKISSWNEQVLIAP
ncbi:MAG: hypothetical protein LQ338_001534 [Usnochroma carphineum]|nr:MAG: hypothetical protein LQ338_001534 [Usnochroma carphineum]